MVCCRLMARPERKFRSLHIWFGLQQSNTHVLLFFLFPVAFCFIFLKYKHSPWASALRKQCRCGRADLCRLKIWPINFPPFFSLNPPLFPLPFALVSFLLVTPFVTSVSISLTHYSVLLLLVCPLALSPFGEGSASSCRAPRSSVIEDAGSKWLLLVCRTSQDWVIEVELKDWGWFTPARKRFDPHSAARCVALAKQCFCCSSLCAGKNLLQ